MPASGKGIHHFHIRKRVHENLEPYPHPEKWKRRMDKAIYAVGIAGPLLAIPQALEVWVEKNVAGISLITWVGWLFLAFFWISYGVMHKEKPIIITYSAWVLINLFIIAGVIVYS
ncbi:MAG: hypothetical protein J4224_01225 [Candidatus Diapherotrites archaeon]|uniref:Uncharacterized protein n=1 Tax=Candidatus Iainarchaeum sp. TaxID=3101447 RepID=A0A7J4IT14_9ARCH|nr:MAG: hypothetical protein QT03_C0001G0810 [archaeon GW2011_AR10]MBS3059028.1 hypothetical protein [Candidatus Diapherotrites archaeon]HIH08663.1 hypothetical protein [Candidatus Diapherotrites archaeon]